MPSPIQRVRFAQGLYDVERFWGNLRGETSGGIVSTVAVAPDGRVLVAQRNGPPVLTFARTGELLAAWPRALALDPHGINVSRTGTPRALLVDRDAHQVLVCTLEGEVLFTLGARHEPCFQAPFNHPTSACFADDGDIYVADGYGNSRVHRFSDTGQHLCSWGSPGTGPGQFSTPHSVWVDRRNRVLVADRENHRVQLFERDGEYLASWDGVYKPMDITEDADGRIYVSDQIPRVTQFRADGEVIGRSRPAWNVPHGIASAPDGRLFCAEMNPNSIVCLTPSDSTAVPSDKERDQ